MLLWASITFSHQECHNYGIDANMLKTTPNGMTTIPTIENEQDVVIVEEPIIVDQHGDLRGDVFREQDHLI